MNTRGDSLLFQAAAPAANALARLSYCNPFIPERITLERQVIGDSYVASEREWNLDPRVFSAGNPNIQIIRDKALELLDRARKPYLNGRGPRGERDDYRDIAYFAVYHAWLPRIDEVIRKGLDHPDQEMRVGFATKVRGELGALLGPLDDEVFVQVIALFFQLRRAFHNIFHFFVGASEQATRLRARVWQSIFTHDLQRYMRSLTGRMREVSTLITGPSGSGKEVVARAIAFSQFLPFDAQRGTFPPMGSLFLPVNIAALSQALIESELFGHRKGAFTGALENRAGFFEICGPNGAVFLDEIGETPPEVQVKLLRVLQERRFQPVGDTGERYFHGKIIAATNRDLEAEIAAGRFRQDLYFRLCSDIVQTPALKDIVEGDAAELERLVRHAAERLTGPDEAVGLTEEVLVWSRENRGYEWPGNFRELEQVVKNILVHGDYRPKNGMGEPPAPHAAVVDGDDVVPAEEVLKRYVKDVYRRNGTYTGTARLVGLDRRTVAKYVDEP